jgi:hypothetical protein
VGAKPSDLKPGTEGLGTCARRPAHRDETVTTGSSQRETKRQGPCAMPWKAVSILWPALVGALMPLDLADIIARFPHILSRLSAIDTEGDYLADDDRSRPRQLDDFRSRFASRVRKAA